MNSASLLAALAVSGCVMMVVYSRELTFCIYLYHLASVDWPLNSAKPSIVMGVNRCLPGCLWVR